jgi:hypothetical protein
VFAVWAAPLKFTVDFVLKLAPLTVRVNAGAPAVALPGLRVAMVGTVPATGAAILALYPQATVRAINATSKVVVAGFSVCSIFIVFSEGLGPVRTSVESPVEGRVRR